MDKQIKLKSILLMLLAFIIYSLTGIFMKLASLENAFSLSFILYYSFVLGVIAFYAVLWQMILKKVPLTIAFMSKSITIVFGLLIAHFLFKETISVNNIIGSLIIIFGILVLGWNSWISSTSLSLQVSLPLLVLRYCWSKVPTRRTNIGYLNFLTGG